VGLRPRRAGFAPLLGPPARLWNRKSCWFLLLAVAGGPLQARHADRKLSTPDKPARGDKISRTHVCRNGLCSTRAEQVPSRLHSCSWSRCVPEGGE
jgi:hypothetical protein